MSDLTREEMIVLIKKVLRYKDGDYYVGSMATAHCYHILCLSYGRDDFEKELDKADVKDVTKIYEYLSSYIEHMLGHPTDICPCCGKERRLTQFKASPEHIRSMMKSCNIDPYKSKHIKE